MLILHLSHTDIRKDARILKQLLILGKEGYKIAGLGVEFNKNISLNENDKIKAASIETLQIKYIPKFLPRIIFQIIKPLVIYPLAFLAIKRLRPQIIHCHDIVMLPLAVGLKFLLGTKIIYDAHELESNRAGLNWFYGLAIYYFEKIFWQQIDGLITVSESIQNWYLKKMGAKISTVIYNIPKIKATKSEKGSNYLREKFSISENYKIFIYVGLFSDGRGIDHLLRLFLTLQNDACIVFLGFGKKQKEIEFAASVSDKIFFHHAVSHDRVVEICMSADVGACLIENVSLSDYLCLPNKLFEYAFARKRILASDLPEISSIVEKYNLGEVCTLDPQSIERAVIKLIKIEEKTHHGEFIKKYSLENQNKKLLNFYRYIENI
ncbi:glycosyltransferase family 4 protein [Alphaproteobacteria bacterium]|nr:glycosyltransferase family 4 protein [Alphaproteobacteria bacterium]